MEQLHILHLVLLNKILIDQRQMFNDDSVWANGAEMHHTAMFASTHK